MKMLWDTQIYNRLAFLTCLSFIFNKYTQDESKKLAAIEDTLCNLDIAGKHFYAGFVKNKHFFLSLAEVSYQLQTML